VRDALDRELALDDGGAVLAQVGLRRDEADLGWLAASKNSGSGRADGRRRGVRIEIDSTLALPSRRPSAYVAVTSSRVPRNSETPW
jgi:hypothetical protein